MRSLAKNQWVFAIVKNPGPSEQITGFQTDQGIKYIPVLRTKEHAEIFLSYMQREPGVRYEVQAIIYEDVLSYATDNQCWICITDEKGVIEEKISPDQA